MEEGADRRASWGEGAGLRDGADEPAEQPAPRRSWARRQSVAPPSMGMPGLIASSKGALTSMWQREADAETHHYDEKIAELRHQVSHQKVINASALKKLQSKQAEVDSLQDDLRQAHKLRLLLDDSRNEFSDVFQLTVRQSTLLQSLHATIRRVKAHLPMSTGRIAAEAELEGLYAELGGVPTLL